MIMWSAIYQGGHRTQCKRYAVKDGYCRQHHPDEESKRGDIKAKRLPVRLWGLLKWWKVAWPITVAAWRRWNLRWLVCWLFNFAKPLLYEVPSFDVRPPIEKLKLGVFVFAKLRSCIFEMNLKAVNTKEKGSQPYPLFDDRVLRVTSSGSLYLKNVLYNYRSKVRNSNIYVHIH